MSEILKELLRDQMADLSLDPAYIEFARRIHGEIVNFESQLAADSTVEDPLVRYAQIGQGIKAIIGDFSDETSLKQINPLGGRSELWRDFYKTLSPSEKLIVTRSFNTISRPGLIGAHPSTMGGVREMPEDELRKIRGFGPNAITVISEAFKRPNPITEQQEIRRTKRFLEGGE